MTCEYLIIGRLPHRDFFVSMKNIRERNYEIYSSVGLAAGWVKITFFVFKSVSLCIFWNTDISNVSNFCQNIKYLIWDMRRCYSTGRFYFSAQKHRLMTYVWCIEAFRISICDLLYHLLGWTCLTEKDFKGCNPNNLQDLTPFKCRWLSPFGLNVIINNVYMFEISTAVELNSKAL